MPFIKAILKLINFTHLNHTFEPHLQNHSQHLQRAKN